MAAEVAFMAMYPQLELLLFRINDADAGLFFYKNAQMFFKISHLGKTFLKLDDTDASCASPIVPRHLLGSL